MARKRLIPQRGWVLEGGLTTLTYDNTTATWIDDVALAFTNLSDEVAGVEREKSTWYFKRIIAEFRLTYIPEGSGNPFGVPVGVRLGTVADDVTLQKGSSQTWNDFDFNEWTHILRDESFMIWEEAALLRDGGAIAVDTSPVATSQTYPIPGHVQKWDLSVNLGLIEDHSLVWGFGPWGGGVAAPSTGDQFTLDWKIKCLVQKRKV